MSVPALVRAGKTAEVRLILAASPGRVNEVDESGNSAFMWALADGD